jgi:LysM domain-containing protein
MANHGRPRRSPARLIAPVALVASLAAVALVVSNSTEGDDNGGDGGNATRTAEPRQPQQERRQRRRPQRTFYRVRLNDTLGLIAEQTGVPVEQLEALNPELDPQNLIVGQRIRLRE